MGGAWGYAFSVCLGLNASTSHNLHELTKKHMVRAAWVAELEVVDVHARER